jgi:hypothetical protein
MDERFNTTITLQIDRADGAKFSRFTLEHWDMGYANVVDIEGMGVEVVQKMHDWAKAQIEAEPK